MGIDLWDYMSTYCPCAQSTTASGAEKRAVRSLWYNKEQHIVPSGNCGGNFGSHRSNYCTVIGINFLVCCVISADQNKPGPCSLE